MCCTLKRSGGRVTLEQTRKKSCSSCAKLLAAEVKVGGAQWDIEGITLECTQAACCATEQGVADCEHALVSDVVRLDAAREGCRQSAC